MGGVAPSLYFFNMAEKTIFQDIDYTTVDDLNILDTKEFGVYTNSGDVKTTLHTESSSSFERVAGLLETETVTSIGAYKGKKVFILPSCNVKGDRVKAALREHKIVVTNDYELADLIVTHSNIISYCDETVRTTSLMQKMHNKYLINEGPAEDYYDKTKNYTIWDSKLDVNHRMYNFSTNSAPYKLRIISGLAINIAKLIEDGAVAVVDVDTVLHSSANVQMLDQTLSDDITAMLNGSDEDQQLAGTMIPTISPKSDAIVLWKFCTNNQHKFSWGYLANDKDIKYWMDKVEYGRLINFDAESYIAYLIENNRMTNDAFKQLEPTCRKEIHISNRELYNFTVQLKPEYQKYLKKEA